MLEGNGTGCSDKGREINTDTVDSLLENPTRFYEFHQVSFTKRETIVCCISLLPKPTGIFFCYILVPWISLDPVEESNLASWNHLFV